eukprot:gnl/TRDRNA2_/TRDRNA2_137289_c0_seq2.p2 gnl/TRDRNA2_/TRDRNA2_137289_c0~~gnl/TRDRNA2_/TRDRNA2_137289_c0_seq2.p2  ORF type:complete len:180 (+),score=38.47 gnl/TRDRNA2_/TRDRNA2_137289_c0_seq2:64-603(+)
MGKRQPRGEASMQAGVSAFANAVRRQLADRQRTVRVFDVGGGGVKTALISTSGLRDLLLPEGQAGEVDDFSADSMADAGASAMVSELQWIEAPAQLGLAPGEQGFAAWLLDALPRLRRELSDTHVVFGVSTAGDIEHATGKLHDWWSGGGYPQQWDDGRPSPLVSELMGLPPGLAAAGE